MANFRHLLRSPGKLAILPWPILFLVVLLGARSVHCCSGGSCKLLDLCAVDSDCAAGLECNSCPAAGDLLQRCHRSQASNATAMDDSLPFNKYSWLTTHNSFSWIGAPLLTGPRVTLINQEDSIADQLKNGVRGLMLDTYDFLGDIWLCHSFGGVCYNATAFEPLSDTLAVIQAFLAANPSEIVTLILEDYVTSPNGLSQAFDKAGLRQYWFPVESMPQNGGDWPSVREMVANNWRLLVFTSKSTKEGAEGIAYEWKYLVENQYGDDGQQIGLCPGREESAALNDTTRSLVLENYFPSIPSFQQACADNSDPLLHMLPVCHAAAGNRWANYLAVDYYKRSRGGGAFQAVDQLNGQIRCGCNTTSQCMPGYITGQCQVQAASLEQGSALTPLNSLPFLSFFLLFLLAV